MSVASIRPRKRLGELLLEAGLLDPTQLQEALAHQREAGLRLGRILTQLGYVDEETVTVALGQQLNLPPVHLDSAPITQKVTRYLPLDLAERYRAFPLSANRRHRLLRVATSDPRPEAERALSTHTGMRVLFFMTGDTAIHRAIRRFYHGEHDVRLAATERFAREPTLGITQVNLAVSFPSKRAEGLQAQTREGMERLHGRMAKLEKLVLTQGFALRGMLEMLDQKGVIHREDLLQRLEPSNDRPPPLPLRRTERTDRPSPTPPRLPH